MVSDRIAFKIVSRPTEIFPTEWAVFTRQKYWLPSELLYGFTLASGYPKLESYGYVIKS